MKNIELLRDEISVLFGDFGCTWLRERSLRDLALLLVEEACELERAVREPWRAEVLDEASDVLVVWMMIMAYMESSGAFTFHPFSNECITRARQKIGERHVLTDEDRCECERSSRTEDERISHLSKLILGLIQSLPRHSREGA